MGSELTIEFDQSDIFDPYKAGSQCFEWTVRPDQPDIPFSGDRAGRGKRVGSERFGRVGQWLANLTSLSLKIPYGNGCTLDLSALSGLPNLKTLELSGSDCYIKDVNFLSGLHNLTALIMPYDRGARVGIDCMDISALSGLSALETLELSFRFSEETREQLEQQGREYDISALSGLTSLKELKLNGYSSIYMDLNHLANLTNLVTLGVNEISTVYGDGLQVNHYGMDFSGLSGLKNLNKLVLDNVSINQVASIPALENLSTLEIQYIHDMEYGERDWQKQVCCICRRMRYMGLE